MILVGDSLGMVVMGRATTVGVTLEEVRHHCTAVAAGASSPLIVGDLPFGTYITPDDAARNAAWLLNNAHVDVVKLEGGYKGFDIIVDRCLRLPPPHTTARTPCTVLDLVIMRNGC